MDSKLLMSNQKKVVEKLNKTARRIQKARRYTKIDEKEVAELEEIHKLLESTDVLEPTALSPVSLPDEIKSSDCSSDIQVALPGVKVFHDNLIFSLFSEGDCCLKNFINAEDKCLIFGRNKSIPTEECFRKLIAYHVTEILMPEEGKCSSISLYAFYLLSVHQDPDFVAACSDFVKYQKFLLRPEEVFPLLVNFGLNEEDFKFEFCRESLLKRFSKGGKTERSRENVEFPFFNVEVVGQILLQYITEDLLEINSNTKSLIEALVKITLDPKIHSGRLLPLYSTILTTLCLKASNRFKLREIVSWFHLKDEHLLNQVEISRSLSRCAFPQLQESLVLEIFSEILKLKVSPAKPPIKISHIKWVLKKLRNRKLTSLELYSLFKLINGSLPGLTATVKDSTEINTLLASLNFEISKVVDSVDLIKLKLEIAKVGNVMMTNTIANNRFTVHETIQQKSSVKKVKCSN